MLIVFGGLPGTGKTTISREVARRQRAVWLRVDAIEQAIRATGIEHVGIAGYAVAQALAEANLGLGRSVVVDAVNPVAEARAAWRDISRKTLWSLVEVEIICSDAAEHRRRVETRSIDIPGLVPPTWEQVVSRRYDDWLEPHLVIDTAEVGTKEAISSIQNALDAAGAESSLDRLYFLSRFQRR